MVARGKAMLFTIYRLGRQAGDRRAIRRDFDRLSDNPGGGVCRSAHRWRRLRHCLRHAGRRDLGCILSGGQELYTGHMVSSLGWGVHKPAPLSFREATYSGIFTLLPLLSGTGRSHHRDVRREATSLAEAGMLKP
jgi:hypothetical protein